MRKAAFTGCAMAALTFCGAIGFDVLLFRNFAAVPPHAASALASIGLAGLVWAWGHRSEL